MPGVPSFLRPIDELTTRLCFNDFNGKRTDYVKLVRGG